MNYIPSKNWWFSWVDWDRNSIAEDLDAIANLGMDHIRVHCLWPIFQPNPTYVSSTAVARLVELLELADLAGLDVEVAVLDGWLSGFNFLPAWLEGLNIFTGRAAIDAEKVLFEVIARSIAHHPRFLGFDLGNELGVVMMKGHPATSTEADAWQAELMGHCNELAPGKLHVNGVDHNHWFRDFGFSREALATQGALTSLHTWIEFTGARKLFPHSDVGCTHLPEYAIELAKAFHLDNDRKVWIQEIGASAEWMPKEDLPGYAEATLKSIQSCTGVWAVTWWCSHDLPDHLSGFHPLEYDLGLLDGQNHPKPMALRIAGMVSDLRGPTDPQSRNEALVVARGALADQGDPPGWAFARQFMDSIRGGSNPAIVLEDRAQDEAYLRKRGISKLIWPN
ncbi:MAG: cellulase family glycosylhydrolase [Chlorobia bacterium]|nr:cellulase family glycosylhydrolase [Fimbriimonadaceae bacterium]